MTPVRGFSALQTIVLHLRRVLSFVVVVRTNTVIATGVGEQSRESLRQRTRGTALDSKTKHLPSSFRLAPASSNSRTMTASSATSINKVDLEGAALDTTLPQRQRAEPTSTAGRVWRQISQGISLEAHGVVPLTPEERTDTNFLKNFTLWSVSLVSSFEAAESVPLALRRRLTRFVGVCLVTGRPPVPTSVLTFLSLCRVSMNGTISAFSTGTLGPLLFSLSMRVRVDERIFLQSRKASHKTCADLSVPSAGLLPLYRLAQSVLVCDAVVLCRLRSATWHAHHDHCSLQVSSTFVRLRLSDTVSSWRIRADGDPLVAATATMARFCPLF